MIAGGDSKAEFASEGVTYSDSKGTDDPQARIRELKKGGNVVGIMQIFWNPRVVELGLAVMLTKDFNNESSYALVNWNEGWEYILPDRPGVRKAMLDQQRTMGGGVVYHLVPS